MKAISLWRPWPWTFFHAGKRFENRTWKPPESIIGELVAMHAAKKYDADTEMDMRGGRFGKHAMIVPPGASAHPTGIVGVFRVTGYIDLEQFEGVIDSPWAFGPVCWTVSDVVQLDQPIPYRGRQGLWNLEDDLAATLLEEIAE